MVFKSLYKSLYIDLYSFHSFWNLPHSWRRIPQYGSQTEEELFTIFFQDFPIILDKELHPSAHRSTWIRREWWENPGKPGENHGKMRICWGFKLISNMKKPFYDIRVIFEVTLTPNQIWEKKIYKGTAGNHNVYIWTHVLSCCWRSLPYRLAAGSRIAPINIHKIYSNVSDVAELALKEKIF